MENPRPEKVAVVNEVRERLDGAQGAILTEYRGLSVREMADLRQALVAAGGDYKVYKNTLVKLAISGGRHQPLEALLEGPTAIAFVSGEVSAVAKALRDYARANPALIVKGGLHGEGFLTAEDLGVLADLPSRDVLLARLAGAIAAPMQQFASLLQALPRGLAYGLSALLDQSGGAPAEAPTETASPETASPETASPETASPETASPETEAGSDAPAEAVATDSPVADSEAAPAETAAADAPDEASDQVTAPSQAESAPAAGAPAEQAAAEAAPVEATAVEGEGASEAPSGEEAQPAAPDGSGDDSSEA